MHQGFRVGAAGLMRRRDAGRVMGYCAKAWRDVLEITAACTVGAQVVLLRSLGCSARWLMQLWAV